MEKKDHLKRITELQEEVNNVDTLRSEGYVSWKSGALGEAVVQAARSGCSIHEIDEAKNKANNQYQYSI